MVNEFRAEAVNVHRAPGGEVPKLLLDLGRAADVRAADGDLALEPLDARAARGAVRGHCERLLCTGTFFGDDLDDLRDDVPALFHQHRVAGADVLAADLVLIVERSARHRRARELHRLDDSHRRKRAGAPDLDEDLCQLRGRLLGRELISNRPPWTSGFFTQRPLQIKVIDFDHHPVDFIKKIVSRLIQFMIEIECLLKINVVSNQRIHP